MSLLRDAYQRRDKVGLITFRTSASAPDAVVATPEGIGSGHDHIRKNYERVLPLIGSLELTPSVQVQGEVIYLTFRAHRDGKDELLGTDTFVIRDGLIQMHTFYAHAPSPTVDDQS